MRMNITIARQLGCGGTELAQMVAAELGVRCIDREIISQTAQECCIDESELAARDERVASFWEKVVTGFSFGALEVAYLPVPYQIMTDQDIFAVETKVMKNIAAQEDCVIVGRGAVHVLKPHPGLINVFLYAPMGFRIGRLRAVHPNLTKEQAQTLIEESDDMRNKFVTQATGQDWACSHNYHLAIDTSSLPLEDVSAFIVSFVQQKMAYATGTASPARA